MTETRHETHDHDGGLAVDLPRLIDRRRTLQLLGGAGFLTVAAACGSKAASSAASGTTATTASTASASTTTSAAGTTTAIPEETAGPYPGDGSNGPNVLTETGIVRRDIRSGFGDFAGTAAGVPATVSLTVLDVSNGVAPLAGAAVYLWHCDRDGKYSLYSVADQNYLRGVQVTGDDGVVTFTTIFPACYSGRWPHIHFEVYESLDAATSGGTKLKTSQLALPEATCKLVYASSGYEESVSELSKTSLATDMVFRDGWSAELATVKGSVADGYAISLNVPV